MMANWSCTICSERHSPKAHILDKGELSYVAQLIANGSLPARPTLEELLKGTEYEYFLNDYES